MPTIRSYIESACSAVQKSLASRHAVHFVLGISFVAGFLFWACFNATWQTAIEGAQILSGAVVYPETTPFSLYLRKLWTVLHQVGALFLLLGGNEALLSVMFSGISGSLIYSSLVLVLYGISRRPVFSLFAAFLTISLGMQQFGVMYPIHLAATEHTYGVIGMGYCAFLLGLLAVGYRHAFFILAGFAPAVHPSLGMQFLLACSISIVFWKGQRPTLEKKGDVLFFIAGIALTLISFCLNMIVFQAAVKGFPAASIAVQKEALTAFLSYWDAHRQPAVLNHPGVIICLCAVAVSALWLWAKRRTDTTGHLLPFMTAVFFASLYAIAGIFMSHTYTLGFFPSFLYVLMPARFINVVIMLVPVILLGLLSRDLLRPLQSALILLFFSIPVVVNIPVLAAINWKLYILVALSIIVISLLAPKKAVRQLVPVFLWLCIAANLYFEFFMTPYYKRPSHFYSTIRSKHVGDDVYTKAASRKGIILTSSAMGLVQLHTRRPILLDTHGLDGLPYSLEAAGRMRAILLEIYGVDLLLPPKAVYMQGALPARIEKDLWESRSLRDWQTLQQKYHFTDIFLFDDYRLSLPLVAKGYGFALYTVPNTKIR